MSAARSSRERGLTLIELVVAMALFALIAVMGLQALTGAMRSRDRLVETEAEAARLAVALALLRADLSALQPLLFFPPDGPPRSALDLDAPGRVLALSVAGQPVLPPGPGPGLRRIEWRFDTQTGTLSRAAWPALYPTADMRPAPAMTVLNGIERWSVRSHWAELGWIAGTDSGQALSAPGPAAGDDDGGLVAVPERYSSALPDAVELVLETTAYGTIVLIESLK